MIGAAILPAAIPRLYAPVQAAERAAASPPAADGSYFMPLERFVIPIFQDGQIARHLFIVVQLHVADLKAGERIREYMPRLTDAFLRDLHTLASRTHASEKGVDLAVAKRRLLATSERVLGPGYIRDVLVVRSFERKLS